MFCGPEFSMDNSLDAISAKVIRRLVPFMMLLFFISIMDRANISYAALQMNADLHFDAQVYGSAAGIFFIGYFLFEIPSNIALAKFGARRWLGRIMITWGLVAAAMAWTAGSTSLHVLRFLLGIAEAGLLPGVMFYLSGWIPGKARGMTLSVLMATTALAYVLGGPFSTWLMSFNGILGFRGWQFMFLVEGVPAVLVGCIVLAALPEGPQDAKWLQQSERDLLSSAIEREQTETRKNGMKTLRDGLLDRRVLLASAFTFFSICDNFGTVFWLPQIIKSLGQLSTPEVGLLSAVPYALGGLGMIVWGRHSDRTGERRLHLFAGAIAAALGYLGAAVSPDPVITFIAICIAATGVWSTFGLLWAYAGDLVAGPAAATGFAVINSVGALGGFVGPFLIGWIKAHTNSFSGGLGLLSGFGLLTALLALCLKAPRRDGTDEVLELPVIAKEVSYTKTL
jgi:ACS family tartrate transporter-like MFS transporter